MLNHMSASSLGMGLRCMEQFRQRYILGNKIPPGFAAHVGSGVHRGAEVDLRAKIATGEDVPVDMVEDAAADGYRERLRNDGVFVPREERSRAKLDAADGLDRAVRLARAWRLDVAPDVQPAMVEQRIEADGDGPDDLPWLGYLDLIDADGRVVDWKTANRRWAKGREHDEVQATVYRHLVRTFTGREPAALRYVVLYESKSKGVQADTRDTERTDDDWRVVQARARLVVAQARAGIFPPAAPGSWNCSPRWCGFWGSCPHISDRLRRLPNV